MLQRMVLARNLSLFRYPSAWSAATGKSLSSIVSSGRRLSTGLSKLRLKLPTEAFRLYQQQQSTMAQRTFQDEDAVYKKPSEAMQYFHSIFEEEFNELYELADGSFNKKGLGLQSFLRMASQFVQHLTMHHTIEERSIFPVLAKRMPAFREDAQHVESHKGIHDGLDRLTELVKTYRREPSTYSPTALRECLDSFREVLFNHLDQEVKDLAPEEFRKHYTAEEMARLPFH